MKTSTICVCKQAIIDKYTGFLSIINVINNIPAINFPLIIPEMCFVLVSEKQEDDPKQIELELSLKLNKQILAKQKIAINYLDKNFNNCVFTINGLVIKETGKLSFIVKRNNRQIAKHEFSVDIETKAKPKIEGKNKK